MSTTIETKAFEGLQFNRVIHDSEFSRVELWVDEKGNRFAKKSYKNPSASLEIESSFLAIANEQEFKFLVLPKLVHANDQEIIQTYIEREHQTRDSIQERQWNENEFESFDQGLREFQRIPLDSKCFSIKQRTMGLLYPVFKLVLNIPKLFKRRELGFMSLIKLGWLSVLYSIKRPFHKSVTVHYDLQTLNCAITPEQRLSILDFEFPYYKGDALFDACYFCTIPPQSLEDWTFQTEIIRKQIEPISWTTKIRLRLILIVCCQVRLLFFETDSAEGMAYRKSLDLLMSGKRFNEFFRRLVAPQS